MHIYFSLVPQQTRKISASPQGCWGGPFTSYGSVLLRDVLSALLHRPFSHRKTLAAAWFPTGWGCQENPEMGGGGGIKKNKQKAYGNRGGKPTTAAVVIQEEKAQACGCKARRTQQPCDGTLSSCCCIAPASITPATEPTPIAPCNTKKGEKKKRFLITERCWGVLPRHATALPPSAAASELEKAQARLTPTSHPSRGTTRCFPPRPKPPPAGASKQIDQKEPTVSTQSA